MLVACIVVLTTHGHTDIEIIMKLETAFSIEILVLTSKTTRRHNPVHSQPRELEKLSSCGNVG
jgi:hypothetical protein